MKRKLLLSFLLLFLVTVLNNQCTAPKITETKVKPPFKNLKIPENNYLVEASQQTTLTLENGSSIIIPSDAFVDANGNPVKEKVKIKYREFHDAADIIMSGIPMTYDSAGIVGNFESAGMFEINGYSLDGKPIFVKDGKKIEVNFASHKTENDYNFYQLDEEEGNWSYEAYVPAKLNANKAKLMEKLEAMAPPGPKPVEPAQMTSNDIPLMFKVDYEAFPELKVFSNVLWKYHGDSDETNPHKNKWVFEMNWAYVELDYSDDNSGVYKLSLQNGSKSFVTTVVPMLNKKDYKKAKKMYDSYLVEYQKKEEKRRMETERIDREADMIRSFSVRGFGIYNYDRLLKQPDVLCVQANVTFENEADLDEGSLKFYLITGNNAVIYYTYEGMNRFYFSTNATNRLVAVLPDDKMAVFSPSDFTKLAAKLNRTGQMNDCEIKMRVMTKPVNSKNELSSLLAMR